MEAALTETNVSCSDKTKPNLHKFSLHTGQVQVALFVPVGTFVAQVKSAGHPCHTVSDAADNIQWDNK